MPLPKITLRKLEGILYRETAIIDADDIPLIMKVLYEEVKHPVPRRIQRLADKTMEAILLEGGSNGT